MTTLELIIILFISVLFLMALAAIVMEEKEEFDYFKTWKW
jgi:hypothetical protein